MLKMLLAENLLKCHYSNTNCLAKVLIPGYWYTFCMRLRSLLVTGSFRFVHAGSKLHVRRSISCLQSQALSLPRSKLQGDRWLVHNEILFIQDDNSEFDVNLM